MKNKNKKNLKGGFAPFLVIAIIAVLAIGGGAYVVTKNKEAKKVQLEDNLDTEANANADANANANANLGINANANAKGSLRSLLALGKNTMCTFTSTAGGINSSGTVYISVDGSMRGDFTSQTSTGTQTSGMIIKSGTSYAWSGSTGVKMSLTDLNKGASVSGSTKSNVSLDSQVDYKCVDWSKDESKFILPVGVKFTDFSAVLKLNADGTIKIPGY